MQPKLVLAIVYDENYPDRPLVFGPWAVDAHGDDSNFSLWYDSDGILKDVARLTNGLALNDGMTLGHVLSALVG